MQSEHLSAADYWKIFADTGSPEAYVRYSQQLKLEEGNAPEDPSPGPAGYGLQRT